MPSIHSKWGTEISIVSGDYLYAKAFLLLADIENPWLSRAFAACAHVICEGEMKQIEKRRSFLMSEAEYLKIIREKTAALFQAACMGGAYFSGTNPAIIERLGDYGYRIGMAFQIVDDCLDLMGNSESLGKTAGLDVYKNDVTLPLLYVFGSLKDGERGALLSELQNRGPAVFQKMKALAAESRAIERAMSKVKEYTARAIADLEGIADSPYKRSLRDLAAHCADRIR